jgi:hypothetical protein
MASRLMTKAILGVAVLAAFSMLAIPALAAGVGSGDCDQTQQKDMLQDGSCDGREGDRAGDPIQQRDRDQDQDGSCDGAMELNSNRHCRQAA